MPRRTHITHSFFSLFISLALLSFFFTVVIRNHGNEWISETHCILLAINEDCATHYSNLSAILLLFLQPRSCEKNKTEANNIKVTNWFFNELFLIVIIQLHFLFIYLFFIHIASCSHAAAILSTSICCTFFYSTKNIFFFS